MIGIREDSLTDYYAILDVEPTASVQDIKRSFRKKVKEQHPDLLKTPEDSQKNIRILIQAYKTLSDPAKREEYNRVHRIFKRSPAAFDYRAFLKARSDDLESQAKLIFFDLLHHHEEDAIELYDRLLNEEGFQLERYLDREDYMDCAYLLSEEYEQRGMYSRAFELLRSIAEYESALPYFKHFFLEVERKLQTIVCYKMTSTEEVGYHLRCINELTALGLPKRLLAQAFKTGVEVNLRNDNHRGALECLEKALTFDPKLKGAAKLHQRINKLEQSLTATS